MPGCMGWGRRHQSGHACCLPWCSVSACLHGICGFQLGRVALWAVGWHVGQGCQAFERFLGGQGRKSCQLESWLERGREGGLVSTVGFDPGSWLLKTTASHGRCPCGSPEDDRSELFHNTSFGEQLLSFQARVTKGCTIVMPFNLSQGKKRTFGETASTYVPLAQQVEAFHKRTPNRYHLRSKKDDISKFLSSIIPGWSLP